MITPRRILPVIVLAQFAGTSLWFAVNAVMPDLQQAWGLPAAAVGSLTSAVQLGFVAGTLVFSLLMVADRVSPTLVFLACSLLGAAVNAVTVFADGRLALLVVLRFVVGFLLAGIYPVGMKIAAAWFRERLGAVLGELVGALVRGRVEVADGFAVVTSRASFEMVQKAARAGFPMLAAISAPTALAVQLADRAGLTLAGFVRGGRHVVYAHAQRLAPGEEGTRV